MKKKEWTQPAVQNLGVSSTSESSEHHEVNTDARSTWMCSCGLTFYEKGELKAHINNFWDESTGNGDGHWEKQLS